VYIFNRRLKVLQIQYHRRHYTSIFLVHRPTSQLQIAIKRRGYWCCW